MLLCMLVIKTWKYISLLYGRLMFGFLFLHSKVGLKARITFHDDIKKDFSLDEALPACCYSLLSAPTNMDIILINIWKKFTSLKQME